jgi:hypothetical protein
VRPGHWHGPRAQPRRAAQVALAAVAGLSVRPAVRRNGRTGLAHGGLGLLRALHEVREQREAEAEPVERARLARVLHVRTYELLDICWRRVRRASDDGAEHHRQHALVGEKRSAPCGRVVREVDEYTERVV